MVGEAGVGGIMVSQLMQTLSGGGGLLGSGGGGGTTTPHHKKWWMGGLDGCCWFSVGVSVVTSNCTQDSVWTWWSVFWRLVLFAWSGVTLRSVPTVAMKVPMGRLAHGIGRW
jgi:hypothetical protein